MDSNQADPDSEGSHDWDPPVYPLGSAVNIFIYVGFGSHLGLLQKLKLNNLQTRKISLHTKTIHMFSTECFMFNCYVYVIPLVTLSFVANVSVFKTNVK